MSEKYPRVGVSTFVYREGLGLLFGRRKKLYGRGLLQVPGGALEYGESFEEGVARELEEETGLVLAGPVEFVAALNFVIPEQDAHWVALKFLVRRTAGEPVNRERDRNAFWKWYPLDRLPDPATLFEVAPAMPRVLEMLGSGPAAPVSFAGRMRAIQDYRMQHPNASTSSIAALFNVSHSTVARAIRAAKMQQSRGGRKWRTTLKAEEREEVRRLHYVGDEGGRRLSDEQLAQRFGVSVPEIHAALIRLD